MILVAVVLVALLAIPVTIGQRARVQAMSGARLAALWAVALLPLAVAWWLARLDGGDWDWAFGGPGWLGPALLIVVFLVVGLTLVALPVAAATATLLWAMARARRPRAD